MSRVLRLVLAALIPDLLTSSLHRLTPTEAHWVGRRLGVHEGLHSFLGLCVPGCSEIDCEVDLALEADLEVMAADALLLGATS